MTTVDMKVESISTAGDWAYWAKPRDEKFLRMEIFKCIGRQLHFSFFEGERIRVEGKLMWMRMVFWKCIRHVMLKFRSGTERSQLSCMPYQWNVRDRSTATFSPI